MAENLDYGEMIPTSENQAIIPKVLKYCYNSDSLNCKKFGGLYNWATAMNFWNDCNYRWAYNSECSSKIISHGTVGIQHQGLCPVGWHIMQEKEWFSIWGGGLQDAKFLRAVWDTLNWKGENSLGFSALPGGYIDKERVSQKMGEASYMWQVEEMHETTANYRLILGNRSEAQGPYGDKAFAMSVRCVKDY